MTKKKQVEILRAARIFNAYDIARVSKMPYIHRARYGSGYTDQSKILTSKKKFADQSRWTKYFYGATKATCEEAFAFAFNMTGIPREQWTTSPFDRTTWFPAAAIDAALAHAEARAAKSS